MNDLTPEDAAALSKAGEEIARIVEQSDVFGYEYVGGNVAGVIYKRVCEAIPRLSGDRESVGGSAWRTRSEADPSRWFVVVVDDNLGLREHVNWGDGKPYEFDENQKLALLERHLVMALESVAEGREGQATFAHYDLGAELRRGGELRIRIGGDG